MEGSKIINEDDFNTTANLKIPEYSGTDPQADNTSQLALRAISKFRKHPVV